jgi:hypothetical protein
MTEYELTQLAERLGVDPVAFVRDFRDVAPAPPAAPVQETDRAARGRALGLSGLALDYFIENAPPVPAKPQETKRLPAPTKPKGTSVPRNVKLREADGTTTLAELFMAMGMSDRAAQLAAEGRDR